MESQTLSLYLLRYSTSTPPRKPTLEANVSPKGAVEAIQKAKRKGLSIRRIARELGINRATMRKYLDAESSAHAANLVNSSNAIIGYHRGLNRGHSC